MIIAGIICLIVGYFFGIIQTSYIYGRFQGIDIREHGSGNAGTTNALRVLGAKAGLIVFLGDLLKSVIAIVLVRIVINNLYPDEINMFVGLVGLGVVLGHNYPFYLSFKGGKGIAATAGIVLGFLDPIIIITTLIVFVTIVAITRYVSLGSIFMVTTFATMYTIFAFTGKYSFDLDNHTSYICMVISACLVIFMALLAILRHRKNIVRLIHHEENKLGAKKN